MNWKCPNCNFKNAWKHKDFQVCGRCGYWYEDPKKEPRKETEMKENCNNCFSEEVHKHCNDDDVSCCIYWTEKSKAENCEWCKPFKFREEQGKVTLYVDGVKHAPVKKIDQFVIVNMALAKMPGFHPDRISIGEWLVSFQEICGSIRNELEGGTE